MPARIIISAIALFFFCSFLPARAETDSTATELNAFWAEVTRTVADGDFAAYTATYHPDAVLVSGYKQTSYPIAAALAGWQQGFLDTQAGKMTANVEFRITRRFNGDTTAHERGIFYYSSNTKQGEATDAYIHFEALLVKKDGWKMMMEYQVSDASEEEWVAAKQQE